ncbi:MAG: UDP-glucose 4-epimerase GalE [Actinobacteria bacterium]|nr:UDP-glucose 4-epimerase GalE [Actinomycetota bacterium]
MKWMLTGGAGYIGAHILRALHDQGHDVVVLDDLSTGLRRKVSEGVPFVEASILDTDSVTQALTDHRVDGVIHLAAKKSVGESVEQPHMYFEQNVQGTMALLDAIKAADVHHMVLSSSAAVYGSPDVDAVTEDTPTMPINPYGQTKLAQEWLVRDLSESGYDLSWVALRYFNVAGAGADDLGDTGVFNLIPMVLRALDDGQAPQVFGDTYPTPDGTCIRDYIHVQDLAEAHVAAVTQAERGGRTDIYNVGRGMGFSVLDVLDAVRSAMGSDFAHEISAPRAGDPASLVAAVNRIHSELGWQAQRDLADMVTSAWSAWQAFPPA